MKEQKEITRAQYAVRLLMNTDRLHRAAMETRMEKLGVHRSQSITLMHIARCGGTNQARLAKCLDVSPAAISVTLKKLEKAGLVERREGADAREKTLSLTEAGRKAAADTHRMFDLVGDEMCRGVTDEEFDAFCAVLTKMIANLRPEEKEDAEK